MRPCDLRMCTSLTCLASLCTLGNGGTDFFVRPQPRHWHWYSTSGNVEQNISHDLILCAIRCRVTVLLTARSIYERRLHVTVLLRNAVIDAIGHVLELPVAVVPAAFVHNILRGVRAYRSRALQLAAVLVHLDRPFLPCLLLSRWQFPPLERKWRKVYLFMFYVINSIALLVNHSKQWQNHFDILIVVQRTVSIATLFFMRD